MPASIVLHRLGVHTPDGRPLIEDLDLAFGPVRTGLIGRNGVGKSTLLRLIAGEPVPHTGEIAVTGTLGMLRQRVGARPGETVAGALGIADALGRLARIEAGTGSEADFEAADWTLGARLASAFARTGLPALDPLRRLDTLSGGQRTRLALAGLILDAPDTILLDEPTNDLDVEGRAAVAELLSGWRAAAIVVSHDRALLNEMDVIVELTGLGATSYGGNWDHYAERKALELAAAEHDLDVAERKVEHVERRVQAQRERKARRDSAGRKKRARGDAPKILLDAMRERAEGTSGGNARLAARMREQAGDAAAEARARIEVLQPMSVRLEPTGLPVGRIVLRAEALTGGHDSARPAIRGLDLLMAGPERAAITGPNGSGKTTLLRLLTGDLAPMAGAARILVPFALLDQTVSILDPALTIREAFRALNPQADENACRAALARFRFRAEAALQVVGTLSGGETLRAGLAVTIGAERPPQLLLLDEPTNHLDIAALEAVEAGLRAYDGALLVVSHDRAFLDAIGLDREIVLEPPP